VTNCSGTPKMCTPLWTAATALIVSSSPAVANGVVYFGGADQHLYAFDAAGVTDCSGTPKTCSPLWIWSSGGTSVDSSPAVWNGVVYVGAGDGYLHVFGLP
jgi:eukaryotic-like serine/threonine-protein kinase